jgi:hypothetical protein
LEEFKYLGTNITNQNSIQEEIKAVCSQRMLAVIWCRIFVSQCYPKIQRIRYTTTLLHVLYGCETWSLTLREEYGLRVFEIRVLRRIFGLKRGEVTCGENYIMRSLMICTAHQILCG